MTDQLASQIYEQIELANEPRKYFHFHASSIAECPRAQYFKRLGIEPLRTPAGGKMLRWRAGHLYEEALRPFLQAIYPDLESNQRFTSKDLDLTGEYDNYSPEKQTLIEIKTVDPRAFKYKSVNDSRFHLRDEKPYLNHEYQNHAYVLLLREKKMEVKFIHYVYITLDGRIATYLTEVQPAIIQNVKTRSEGLKMAWEEQIVPGCLCQPDHPLWKSCMQFCDYYDEGTKQCCSINLKEDLWPEPKKGEQKQFSLSNPSTDQTITND